MSLYIVGLVIIHEARFRFIFDDGKGGVVHQPNDWQILSTIHNPYYRRPRHSENKGDLQGFHQRFQQDDMANGQKPKLEGVGYSTKFYMGRLPPEAQPLTLLYTILTEKVPVFYIFNWEKGTSCKYFHNWPVLWINRQKFKSSCHFHVVPNKWNDTIKSCACSKYFKTFEDN